MKSIVLYGSTGMIGQRILAEALSRGHNLTAVVRETSVTGEHRANLAYRTGDPSLIVKATHSLIEGLTRVEPIRLIAVSGAGSLEVKPGLQLVDTPNFPAAWKPAALAHRDAIDIYRKAGFAGFDWTAASPAALIQPGTRTGKYRTATEQLIVDDKGVSRISAEDFAVAILDEVENPKFKQMRFTAAY